MGTVFLRRFFYTTVFSTSVFASLFDADAKFLSKHHHAKPYYNDVSNMADVYQELRLNGVKPHSVKWSVVNQYCVGINGSELYNCKLAKALTSVDYRIDLHYCNDVSKLNYPSYKARYRNNFIHRSDNDGSTRKWVYGNREFNRYEHAGLRESSIATCMRSVGWKNPRSWLQGKSY